MGGEHGGGGVRSSLQGQPRAFNFKTDTVVGYRACVDEHAAHKMKMKEIYSSKTKMFIPAPLDRRWQCADSRPAMAPPEVLTKERCTYRIRRESETAEHDLHIHHFKRRTSSAGRKSVVDNKPPDAYHFVDKLRRNRAHVREFKQREHDYNVAHMLHRMDIADQRRVIPLPTDVRAHERDPVYIFRRGEAVGTVYPKVDPSTIDGLGFDLTQHSDATIERSAEQRAPRAATDRKTLARFEQMLMDMIVEKGLYHDEGAIEELIQIAISRNKHLDVKALNKVGTDVLNMCYIPPAPFEPAPNYTTLGMSNLYGPSGMPASTTRAGYIPTDPQEYDFINRPGSFALVDELTDVDSTRPPVASTSLPATGTSVTGTSATGVTGISENF